LNRAVREFKLTQPSSILNKTLEIVKESFEKSEDEIKDGMDLVLCCLNKNDLRLQFAGANNPLLIYRDGNLIEIKADKQPIGISEYNKPFTNQSMQMMPGDVLYLSSDGYADQFGGENGRKKLTKKKFKEMLGKACQLPIEDQHQYIRNFYFAYKKDTEQIDDVLLLGVML
jgi:serine phosphatase RsbU (regulator of sigma subunit)